MTAVGRPLEALANGLATRLVDLLRHSRASLDDPQLGEAMAGLVEVSAAIHAEHGDLRLSRVGPSMFLNGEPISPDQRLALLRVFDAMGAQEIVIPASLDEGAVRLFLSAFDAHEGGTPTRGLGPVEVIGRIGEGSEGPLREMARLVAALEDAFAGLDDGTDRGVPAVRRCCQRIHSAMGGDEGGWFGLVVRNNPRGSAAHHAANMAVILLAMGRELGLPRREAVDLAMAGVFGECGWDRLPTIFATETDRERFQLTLADLAYPSALRICGGPISEQCLHRVAVAWEHRQVGEDGPEGGPTARLVAVASAWLHLVAPEAPGYGLSADEALRVLVLLADKRFEVGAVALLAAVVAE